MENTNKGQIKSSESLENKRKEIMSHKLRSKKDRRIGNFSTKEIGVLIDMVENTQEEMPLITAKQSIDALATTMKNLGAYKIYEKKRIKIKKNYSFATKERVYRKNLALARDLIHSFSQPASIFRINY
jgi:hypothetical protein